MTTASNGRGALHMLRGARAFEELQQSRRTRSDRLLMGRFRRTEGDVIRFGFSTGRRLGTAVVRNRVRRRLREIIRSLLPRLQPGWDVLLVVRPPAVEATYQDLATAVERVLRQGGVMRDQEQT